MAAIQGCEPGRAELPPRIRARATDTLFLCFFPQTGFFLRCLEGRGSLGTVLSGMILLEEAERSKANTQKWFILILTSTGAETGQLQSSCGAKYHSLSNLFIYRKRCTDIWLVSVCTSVYEHTLILGCLGSEWEVFQSSLVLRIQSEAGRFGA